jgi:hypothetical protein
MTLYKLAETCCNENFSALKKSCDWGLLSLHLPYLRTNWPDWFLSVPSFLIFGMLPDCRANCPEIGPLLSLRLWQ